MQGIILVVGRGQARRRFIRKRGGHGQARSRDSVVSVKDCFVDVANEFLSESTQSRLHRSTDVASSQKW